MHEIELVVFDMAGTTVNDEGSVNRCIREVLGAVGLEVPPAAVDRVMGLPKPQALSILIDESGRLLDLGPRLDAIHRDFVARSTAYYRNDPAVREVDGRLGGLPGRCGGRASGSRLNDRIRPGDHRRHPRPARLDGGGADRRDDRQRRGGAGPAPPGHDPRADAATGRRRGRAGREGGRYARRPRGRDECGLRPGHRRDEREPFPSGAGALAAHPPGRERPRTSAGCSWGFDARSPEPSNEGPASLAAWRAHATPSVGCSTR